VGFAGA